MVWPNEVSAGDRAGRIGDDRGVEGEPGDDAGQRDAGGHVIVDADHVGAQARIDRDRAVGAEAAGELRSGRNPTWKFPLYAGVWPVTSGARRHPPRPMA